MDKAPSPAKPQKIEPLVTNIPKPAAQQQPPSQTVEDKVNKAQSLLDELNREESHGYKLGSGAEQKQKPAEAPKKNAFEITDNYDDDFEYDIEEELPVEEEQPNSARNVADSGQGITVS